MEQDSIDKYKTVNIDDADIFRRDENNFGKHDASMPEADADITHSHSTDQTPHDTKSKIQPKHVAEIQAVNDTQHVFSTQTIK